MRINHNLGSINTFNQLAINQSKTQKSLERLSSGLRINRASDDAAGLSISEKMRGQIRGLDQSSRNIQDAISLVQVAEGGLNEIHSLLQRGRELSVQAANGTTTISDRTSLNTEVAQISEEINRIASSTEFNTINLLKQPAFNPKATEVLTGLKSSWLKQSIDTISTFYGITPDSVNLNVNLDNGSVGGITAYVSYTATGAPGLGTITGLTIELADYDSGKIGGLSADRTIAHEMVHAVMTRTMNMDVDADNNGSSDDPVIPTWFKEGAAEFIHGAKERVYADTSGGTNAASVMSAWGASWSSTSEDYSAAYSAVVYLHEQIKANGGNGIKDIMAYLAADTTRTLDDAITNASSGAFTNLSDFTTSFTAAGSAFILGFTWASTDTGAIGGLDIDGGTLKTDTSVISDTTNSGDPTPFIEIYPSISVESKMYIQVGANSGQALSFSLSNASTTSLGLGNIDLVTSAPSAITSFDSAIETISNERSRYGAIQNRLEYSLSISRNSNENLTNAESRIRDSDMAKETMEFTKRNILVQAAQSMMAQTNQQPQSVLQLLR